jgi:hypothetical protein
LATSIQWGRRKKLDAEQEVAFVLSATYVLTFNDEANRLEDEAAAEFGNKNPWNWQDRTENKQQISLFDVCYRPPAELANVSNTIFHEDRVRTL